ncbi:hypothetical protein DCO58_00135 [Helicobacter saguini]|uniref:Uncharacterized protein n=1 Tax=Helicobacter saguini TaxID=1548018 RepID=A0A4U8T8H5_9HELI|nr:hypothetical protein [Helicobacter saguini]MWV63198.1 hypothetical protein [Helicobacter saguini]MWV66132.1 hypothetical protein [Helicobacter saguini]MWV68482.1 hypothetical protein [Helicobacter saguini]MWV71964.1 hypothetical protein [Helicobacter saguini]TLD95971.1 hypothetical protein LS64_001015 [Helicobacter saguini]
MEKMMDIKGIRFIESILWELENGEPVAIKEPLKIKYILESKQDFKDNIESKQENKQDSKNNIESKQHSKETISQKIESKSIESNSQIKWAYIAFKTTQHLSHKLIESALDSITQTLKKRAINNKVIYKNLSDKSNFFVKNNMFDKIGFHLPLKELDNLVCYDLDSIKNTTKDSIKNTESIESNSLRAGRVRIDKTDSIESKNQNAAHHPISEKTDSKNQTPIHRPTFDRIQTPTNRPIEINPDSINFPLKYPFAPGTYIELEINDIESKQDSKENTESNIESNKEKTYTIVFAFNKSQNMPNINDKYIVIDTSFYLGIKENQIDSKNTQDSNPQKSIYNSFSKNVKPQTSKPTLKTSIPTHSTITKLSNMNDEIKIFNEYDNIENLHEAVWFIVLCRFVLNNDFNTLRIYPQLTGKIGYIYHIFDTFNKDFLRDIKSKFGENVKEHGNIYLESLQYDFVNKIVNLYMNKYLTPFSITFKPQVSEDSKLKLMREFIESLNDIFEIYAFQPSIEIADLNKNIGGTYYGDINAIYISRICSNMCSSHEMFMILAHEYRHFFIRYLTHFNKEKRDKYNLDDNIILMLLESCIEPKKFHKIIFDSFGDPYRLNPHEKDAYLMEQILNLVIESTFAIRFNMTSNSKLR